MLVAKIKDGTVHEVAELKKMFPLTSFPAGGPPQAFMQEHGLVKVVKRREYDKAAERLVKATPYMENGIVYLSAVEALPQAELRERKEAAVEAKRRTELPSVEKQLDMLYEDMENGTTKWRDAVRAVKEKYPEPVRGRT